MIEDELEDLPSFVPLRAVRRAGYADFDGPDDEAKEGRETSVTCQHEER